VIRAAFLCATVALTMLCAGTASAAFPGKPGPIAYSKQTFDIISDGRDVRPSAVGGIFTHGPRVKQRPRQLTTSFYDQEPSYSSDGRWIVFVGLDAPIASSGIYVMRSDGSERRLVIADGSHPIFFPSGRAIAFVRTVDGRQQIFTVRLDGSGLRQLTGGPSESFDPAVSPNGERIAFASDRDREGRDRNDIYTMRPDGSGVRVAIAGPRSERRPDWAPNGRRIAYVVGGSSSDLFVARADGSRALRLTPCEGIRCRDFDHPAFSPDGRHLVALSTSNRSSGIEVFRSDGRGSYVTFADAGFGEEGEGSFLGVPTWGPG
jgi:Tol biopolymer transport system component